MRRALFVVATVAALWLAPGALAAPWCGSGVAAADRLPELVTGPQIHVLYVSPSDGADRFPELSGSMADEADQIDSWWRAQDFTRTVRFDRYAFPSCDANGGLDITDVKLPQPTSDFYPAATRYQALASALRVGGWNVAGKKYLVYYDGLGDSSNLCGQGGGQFALVFVQACAPYASAAVVAAHELIHALGAVYPQAPHGCPDSGHVCGDTSDIMNPTLASFRPLSEFGLDIGHDDYYAHSGTWPDVQDSPFLHLLNAPSYSLTVDISGGSATVTSDLPGLACTSSCVTTWDAGTPVKLVVAPAEGLRLVKWTGACAGAGDCELTMGVASSVKAILGPATVKIRVAIFGRGRVLGGAPCTVSVCTRTLDGGTGAFLSARPAKGWRFAGWSGACRGRGECSPATDADSAVTARFVQVPKPRHRA